MDNTAKSPQESEESHDTILVLGLVCMDLIFSAKHYPKEDSANRALEYFKRRGGNASNSCTVLSQLGAKCELMAPMTSDEYAELLKRDLTEKSIMFHHSPVYPEFETAITSVVLSQDTGTRTILHYRHTDYPENTINDFNKLNLFDYKWVHFEGRSINEVLKMIDVLDLWNEKHQERPISYSVELEKCADVTKALIPKGHYIFVSKEFARYLGYQDSLSAIHGLTPLVKPGATIIVPWGELGAMARGPDGIIIKSNACPPPHVLDSTGAGDTFIAAAIFYLSNHKSLVEAIDFANRIAGAKCGMMGFNDINSVYEKFKKCNSYK